MMPRSLLADFVDVEILLSQGDFRETLADTQELSDPVVEKPLEVGNLQEIQPIAPRPLISQGTGNPDDDESPITPTEVLTPPELASPQEMPEELPQEMPKQETRLLRKAGKKIFIVHLEYKEHDNVDLVHIAGGLTFYDIKEWICSQYGGHPLGWVLWWMGEEIEDRKEFQEVFMMRERASVTLHIEDLTDLCRSSVSVATGDESSGDDSV